MKLKQNKQSKLVVALSAVILLLVALSATLTFAYFTASKDASNQTVEFGHLNFKDNETLTRTAVADAVPGYSAQIASGTVTLQHNIDAFYRVGVTVTLKYKGTETTPYHLKNTIDASSNKITTVSSQSFGQGQTAVNTITNEEVEAIQKDVWNALSLTTGNDNANVNGDYVYGFAKANTDISANSNTLTTGTKIIDASSNGKGSITFDKEAYGNKWQDVEITITITVQAIQAENVGVTVSDNTLSKDNVTALAALNNVWGNTSGVVKNQETLGD